MTDLKKKPLPKKQHLTALVMQQLANPTAKDALLNSWPHTRCEECKHRAATGIWLRRYSKTSPPFFRAELDPLCASCGLSASQTVMRCDLLLPIIASHSSSLTHADRLIERLLSHPQGEAYVKAWKLMYKPANIHHLTSPAELMLEALVEKLFPPQTNKVD